MNGQRFSLSFSKRIEKKTLQPSALGGEGRAEVKQTAHALLAVDHHSLQVNENVEEKEDLVIPLLQAKRSAVLSKLARLQQEDEGKDTEEAQKSEQPGQETQEDSKPLTLEEKAERALLEESRKRLDEWRTKDIKDITIPAPAEDPLAAPLVDIGKESSLDDYDEIAVESFGAAVLRGMGWKKSEGIGGRKKRVVEIIDPSSKTLGSSEGKGGKGTGKEGEEEGEEEEELPIVKGSFVFLHSGRHRGTYGVVEVVDEDHLLVRAAVGQAVLREVEGNLRLATQKEYKESSRVINKEMYDQYKEAELKKKSEATKRVQREEEDKEDSGSDRDRKRSQKAKKRGRDEPHRANSNNKTDVESGTAKEEAEGERNRKTRDRDSEREKSERLRDEIDDRDRNSDRQRNRDEEVEKRHRDKETERQRHKEREYGKDRKERYRESKEFDKDRKERYRESEGTKPHKDTQAKRKQEEVTEAQKAKTKQQKMEPPWVRENLRVRIINKNYKGGKYHKEKVVVVSVVTAESCECLTEGGRLLGDVDPAWLETVIPKQPPMVVMVVKGPHKGQKGRILQLHREQEKASIQLLEDETTILKLHYDDICEFVLR